MKQAKKIASVVRVGSLMRAYEGTQRSRSYCSLDDPRTTVLFSKCMRSSGMKLKRTSGMVVSGLAVIFAAQGALASSGCKDATDNLHVAISNRIIAEQIRDYVCRDYGREQKSYSDDRNDGRNGSYGGEFKECLAALEQVSTAVKATEKAAAFFEQCKEEGRL
jgi:hypothetical protein